MTTPRQRELTRLMNIRTFILILGFFCFWIPLMYFWAWNLEPLNLALCFALLIGGGCGLCLLPYWMDYGRKIDRHLKYNTLFSPFFSAMIEEMEANDAEKGDSWLTMDEPELRKLQNKTIKKLQRKKRTIDDDFQYQKELANYCAMVYLRGIMLE